MKTNSPEVQAAFNRLSQAALCQPDGETQCSVERNDLSTILLAYRLELGNNQNNDFGVIAGKYDPAYDDGENIKYADDGLTFAEALKRAGDMANYQFCYITYKDHRLSLN